MGVMESTSMWKVPLLITESTSTPSLTFRVFVVPVPSVSRRESQVRQPTGANVETRLDPNLPRRADKVFNPRHARHGLQNEFPVSVNIVSVYVCFSL